MLILHIMKTGVYGIFSKIDQECLYVGITSISFEGRWSGHRKDLLSGKHPRKAFVDWVAANGVDNLEFRILCKHPPIEKELNSLEIEWFNKLNPKFWGKSPSENEKWCHSEETRKKIKASMLNAKEAALLSRGWKGLRFEHNGAPAAEITCSGCSSTFLVAFRKSSSTKFCSTKCQHASYAKVSLEGKEDEIVRLYLEEKLSASAIARLYGLPSHKRIVQLLRAKEIEIIKRTK